MKLGIVIPSFNEAESIAALVTEIRCHVGDSEVVIVDDSPNDLTADAIAPLLNDCTHIIRRKTKGGRGTAVIEGIAFLIKRGVDRIIEMDADFSHPPAQISELACKAEHDGIDLLIASRYLPQSKIRNWPLSRKVFSFFSNKLARGVLSVPISDYTNGFRCYSLCAAEVIVQTCGKLGTGFIALSEILVNLYYSGYRVSEVPTIFVNRVRGESSLNSKEISDAFKGLIRIHGLKKELMRCSHESVAKGAR
jgi:dolichol-phosphate mannosyltransferase